jgi:hypothetical protein
MTTLKSGLAAQLGFAAETTAGTRVVPTRFLEFVDESMSLTKERIESRGLRAGRRLNYRWAAGIREVSGDVTVEMAPQGTGLLLSHAIGTVATTGTTGAYVHSFSPGPVDQKTLTVQIGKPGHGGVIHAFDYIGVSVVNFELSAEVGQFLMGKFGLYGMDETTGQTLATASYPTGYSPFVFTQGSLSIASADFCVRSVAVNGDNALETGRHRICATNAGRPQQALEAGFREYGGNISADFVDLTAYNRFVNGAEASLSLAFDAGTGAKLTIAGNVRFDGSTPTVGGPELLEQALPFKFTSGTSDAAAFTVTLENADSTP